MKGKKFKKCQQECLILILLILLVSGSTLWLRKEHWRGVVSAVLEISKLQSESEKCLDRIEVFVHTKPEDLSISHLEILE
ncbi:MAG: hypothetical protein LBS33_01310, partial [Streptococcaceae bacterium]|nr:hypothetical protein [Streptococcaceae bacterium]